MSNLNVSVLLVGCGKMGGAMLQGWRRKAGLGPFVTVEPDGAPEFDKATDVTVLHSLDALPASFAPDVVVFATKPQVMDQVVPAYARFSERSLFVSIAAGKTTEYFRHHLGPKAAIVRAMPNMPAAVGRGVTVSCPTSDVTQAQRTVADRLLCSVGAVEWVIDESLIDAATAVSGSGPAYVFLLVEAMAVAGARAGLPEDLAMRLACATVSGAGELLRQTPESAEYLRESVTAPKGTTAAALEILMGPDGLAPLLNRAIDAAAKRSRELAT